MDYTRQLEVFGIRRQNNMKIFEQKNKESKGLFAHLPPCQLDGKN